MKNLLENNKMLVNIVSGIENCEESFKVKGLESMSCSLNRNEQKEVIVDIVASFDIDKVLVNIKENLILYGEDKFLPHGDKKLSFILDQMKEVRKTFDYMIESFQVSFNSDKEGKLIMDIACSLNMSKFKMKGKEVLSSKRKESISLGYEKIYKDVDKACEKTRKQTSEHLKRFSEEIKKNLDSKSYFSEDVFNEIFGDKGDLK